MYSKQIFQQLLVAVAMLSVAQSTWLDTNRFDIKAIAKRQLGDLTGGDSGSKTTQGTATGGSTPNSSSSSSSSSSSTPSTTPSSTTDSSTPSSTPASTTSTTPESSSSSTPASTTSTPEQTSTTPKTTPSSTPTAVVSTTVHVVTMTNTDGSKTTVSSTSRTTTTPGLSSPDGETSGMSTKTRNTVIGVVVGVGGAIVLGALGLVAWRIWGRKKHNEENDGLMDYDMSTTGGVEKSERGSSAGGTHPQRTPFQSTLENYHQPGQVNASSNF
ncbi:Mid2-like cell wall stress sensor [Pochonia chlamydosporia 170]|uniref:Mid2-like cell wall stress sensor n=1 Tax=Pochonia chlamydosporia 170 TaxID=1380566 RepID=A0A179FP76_METCM|nr:Mid2-like cell wall stress sensor [Pochonia chlamydosporia 170]OAQ67040.1 Mid2-like cell wall stress sensor [Pochonia chlamydosporia 170]